jgi:hypothetical protein
VRVTPIEDERGETTRLTASSDDHSTRVSAHEHTPQQPSARLQSFNARGDEKARSSPYLKSSIVGAIIGFIILGLGLAAFLFLTSDKLVTQKPGVAVKPTPMPAPSAVAVPADLTPAPAPPARPTQQPTPRPTVSALSQNVNVIRPPDYDPGTTSYSRPTPPPVNIVSGTFIVQNLQTNWYTFQVPEGFNGVVSGNFSAQGGYNDINVLVMTMGDLARFNNFSGFSAYFNSGYSTARSFSVTVPPGDHALVFNNRRSLVTSKAVTAYVQVRFQ